MLNADFERKSGLKIKKRTILWLVLIVLLAVNVTLMGISLAKYVQRTEQFASADILSFMPTGELGEEWEIVENFRMDGAWETRSLPFQVKNAAGHTPVNVVLTLSVEQVLPLQVELYVGEELLTATETTGDTRIYEYPIGYEDVTFSLQAEWLDGEYDERFSDGITNYVHLSVVCEQVMQGGAS